MRTGWGLVVVLCGWRALAGSAPEMPARELRTWTSVSGASVKACLEFNYGTWVLLRQADGEKIHIRTAYLAEEDKEYLRGFGATKLGIWKRIVTPDPDLIDINSASPNQLKMLPRIGDSLARRIVEGRPYSSTKKLTEIGGIGQKTFEAFKGDIVARPVKKEPRVRKPLVAAGAATKAGAATTGAVTKAAADDNTLPGPDD